MSSPLAWEGLQYLKIDNQTGRAAFMIHGYGASMYDLYGLGDMLSKDYDWYFPNGLIGMNNGMMMSRAWFPIDEQALQLAMMQGTHRDMSQSHAPQMQTALEKIHSFIQFISAGEKIILGGFSQGAMLSSHLADKLKQQMTHLILFSGNLFDAPNLIITPAEYKVFQSHGRQDPILGFEGAKKLKDIFLQQDIPVQWLEFNGGHEIPLEIISACQDFLKP